MEIFQGWEIEEQIGQGGFSTVYRIKKSGSGEYYAALKVVTIPHSKEEYENYSQDGYDDETITAMFEDQVKKLEEEFKLMARFKGNSNIVSYEDHMVVRHEDGKGWDILIRMELLEPLTKKYMQCPLDVNETVKLGVDICRALELCGKYNVIHRDIKPQNIFVNDFGDYKLGDFGIARTMDHTTHATKIGTFTYIAPEVYKGESYNSNVDIYSLGLVLYWLLNERRLPFVPLPPAVPSPSAMSEATAKRLNGDALPAPKNGSEALKKIVLKACAFKPEDRYQSATQMRMELERELYAIADSVEQTPTVSETVKQAPTASEAVKQAPTASEAVKQNPIDATVGLGGGKSPDMSSKQVDSSDFGGDRTMPLVSPLDLGNGGSGKADGKSATDAKSSTDSKSTIDSNPAQDGKSATDGKSVQGGKSSTDSKTAQGGKPKSGGKPTTDSKTTTESKTTKSNKTVADNKTATDEIAIDSKTDSTGKPKKKKKKIILKILIILFALCAIGAIVYFGFIRGKYYMGWSMRASLSNGTLTISGKGDMPDFDDVPWYNERKKITNVVIKDGVTSIGYCAFYECYFLESVSIPDSVTSIGEHAFAYCDSLASVTIPDSVTSIGYHAFYDCDSLKNITIPDSVTSIGEEAFSECQSLASVTIGDSVTSIGEDAFRNCDSLESIVVSSGNKMYHSKNNCIIEASTETLVLGCKNSVIPTDGSVTSIGDDAFRNCDSLVSITIPDSVTSIGEDAFAFCDSLESVTIGDSVNRIGDYAFAYCDSLTSIAVSSGNKMYHSKNNCIIETSTKILVLGCKNSVIPTDGSVTSIGEDAFAYCDSLESITIPDSVTSIGDSAFYGCYSLVSITIGDSVTSIGDYAFDDCGSLESVTIGDSVTSIGYDAFSSCDSLKNITIPDSVTSIGGYAFFSCDSLESITIPDSVTSIGYRAFDYCYSLESVTFKDPNGWYVTTTGGATSGTNVTVTDKSTAAKYLTDEYQHYYWYKK